MLFVSFLTFSILSKSKGLILITFLMISIFALVYSQYQVQVATPRGVDKKGSANARLNTWEYGLSFFKSYPILGIGFNTYRYGLRDIAKAPDELINVAGGGSNDSSLLHIASTTGLIGLASFLGFILSLLFLAWKKMNTHFFAKAYVAGITGLFFHSFFTNSLFYPPILLWILLTANFKEAS